jgi:hypothetical protein
VRIEAWRRMSAAAEAEINTSGLPPDVARRSCLWCRIRFAVLLLSTWAPLPASIVGGTLVPWASHYGRKFAARQWWRSRR